MAQLSRWAVANSPPIITFDVNISPEQRLTKAFALTCCSASRGWAADASGFVVAAPSMLVAGQGGVVPTVNVVVVVVVLASSMPFPLSLG